MEKTIRHILLYKENSDAACISSARYFHDLDNAKKAMLEDFEKQNKILNFPPSDPRDPFYNEENNSTTVTDLSIHVNMDIDSFHWEIIVDAKPED